MPTVLFLPDLHYDHRIWADIPGSLGGHCDVLHYDVHEPVPWAAPESFVPALRRLLPEDGRTLAVAAGYAAGFAVRSALSGTAGGLVLFQPAPDYLPPEAFREVPAEDLIRAAEPYSGLIAAVRETDPARRGELAISTMQGVYRDGLSEADLALLSRVAGDHVDELLATTARTIAAVEAGRPAPHPGLPWVDQLAEVTVPVSVIASGRARPVGEAIAKRIPAGRFTAADAKTDLPWLEDRTGATSVLLRMLTKL